MRGLVIIGRRSKVTDDDRRRLKSVTFNERVNVRSYDWLVDEAAERIQHAANLTRGRQLNAGNVRPWLYLETVLEQQADSSGARDARS